jgi:hypothetical protein
MYDLPEGMMRIVSDPDEQRVSKAWPTVPPTSTTLIRQTQMVQQGPNTQLARNGGQQGLFSVDHGQDRGGRIVGSSRSIDHIKVRSTLVLTSSGLVLATLNLTAGSILRDRLPRGIPERAQVRGMMMSRTGSRRMDQWRNT